MKFLMLILTLVTSQSLLAEPVPAKYQFTYFAKMTHPDSYEADLDQIKSFLQRAPGKGWTADVRIAFDETWIVFNKKEGEMLSMILDRTQGCELLQSQCEAQINFRNREARIWDADYAGKAILPVKIVLYRISLEAGQNYREEVTGRSTKAYMSRELHLALAPLRQNTFGGMSSFCSNVDDPKTCSNYELVIE